MIRFDHDGYLAAARLVSAHTFYGRDSDEFQSWLDVVMREYDVAQAIVALCAIATSVPNMKPFTVIELAHDAETMYSRFLSGEFDE